MSTHIRKHLKTWLAPVALLVVLSSLFITRTVLAKVSMNTIDTIGIVTDRGRQVTVTGPIAVTESERTELRETVTQRSTGAVAEGRAPFEAGPAAVVGLARSSINGQATDAHQWLVNVTLRSE